MKVLREYVDGGIKVEELESGETRYTNPEGRVSTMPAPDPVLVQWIKDNIDPRIDLTKPIYEQSVRLREHDRKEEERLKEQQHEATRHVAR